MVNRESLERLALASDDDAARRVFADWLEQQGDAPRAQLIHLQCERAKHAAGDRRYLELGWEIDALWAEHGARFCDELPALDGVEWVAFDRGFASTVRVRDAATLYAQGEAIAKAAPVSRVQLTSLGAVQGSAAHLAWVKRLHISRSSYNRDFPDALFDTVDEVVFDAGDHHHEWMTFSDTAAITRLAIRDSTSVGQDYAEELARHPWGQRLTSLEMTSRWVPTNDGYGADPDPRLGSDGARSLGRLVRLERLVIDRQRTGPVAFGRLLESLPALRELSAVECQLTKLSTLGTGAPLEKLTLSQNRIGVAGARTIAKSPRTKQLCHLELDTCEIESVGLVELARAPLWQTLRYLDLSRNPLGASGVRALAEAPAPSALVTLLLADADLDQNAGHALAKLPWLAQLAVLDLSGNRIQQGAASLRSFAPEQLRSLSLSATGLERAEAAVVSRFWPRLVHLDLGHNPIGDAGIERFAGMKEAAALQTLALYNCNLTGDGIDLLAHARCPRLRTLDIANNAVSARALETLLRAPMAAGLEVLNLAHCGLDGAAIAVLARTPLPPRLRHLNLRGNVLDAAALVALADSPTVAKVKKLEVDGNPWSFDAPIRERLEARFGPTWYTHDD